MTESTRNIPSKSEQRDPPAPVSQEATTSCCTPGFMPVPFGDAKGATPFGDAKDAGALRTSSMKPPGWRTLAVVCWLQHRLNQIISQLHLLSITRGRSLRWQRLYRQLAQAGVALLVMVGVMPMQAVAITLSFQASPNPAYALNSHALHPDGILPPKRHTPALFAFRSEAEWAGMKPGMQGFTTNPFEDLSISYDSAPSFADLDGDGDLDFISGSRVINAIQYFENTGDAASPAFSGGFGSFNAFGLTGVGWSSTPSFADLDGDGDLDSAIGEKYGLIHYFENTGSSTSPAFVKRGGSLNPFNAVDVGVYSAPSFADLDGDGDLDLFSGEFYGTILYFENIEDATNPTFIQRSGSLNPFDGVDVGDQSGPTFADLDVDGDLDAIIGEGDGFFNYFENIGDAISPAFVQRTGSLNPLTSLHYSYRTKPSFADLDADGGLEGFSGEAFGHIGYIYNTKNITSPFCFLCGGSLNPLHDIDVGYDSAPSFADLDGDGDLDTFIGEYNGTINYYQNTGNAINPAFIQLTGTLNPLTIVNASFMSIPSFADLDADGDLDAFIGGAYELLYFQNTGSATSPAFILREGTLHPFYNLVVGQDCAPSFADLDADGDLDALIGEYFGTIKYFENTGSATSPVFAYPTGTLYPFYSMDVGYNSTPSFDDLDRDGDLDAIIGEQDGIINFFQNTGTATSPAFVLYSGVLNPINGVDVGLFSTPSFADLDADGDLDAFIGESEGTIYYFENISLSWHLTLPLVRR